MLTDKIVNFRYDRAKAQMITILVGHKLIQQNGVVRPTRISDILRKFLDTWLKEEEKFQEYYNQLVHNFKNQKIDTTKLTELLKQKKEV